MRTFTFNGKSYSAKGRFGEICLYQDSFCIAFDIMTMNDAENLASAHAFEAPAHLKVELF